MPEITLEEAKKELDELVKSSIPETEEKVEEKPEEKGEEKPEVKEEEKPEEKPEEKAEDVPEEKVDKVGKRKAEIQSDIDGLIAKKKTLEEEVNQTEQVRAEMKALRDEIETLKQEKVQIDAEKKIPEERKVLRDMEQERIKKIVEEDAELPLHERREMTEEALSDFYLEDPVKAQEFISERALRRARERAIDENKLNTDKRTAELIKQQAESEKRVLIKHPELNISVRGAELEKEGKTKAEINEILKKENEKYRVFQEIVESNPSVYLTQPNGVEMVAEEMEKRLGKVDVQANSKIEELTAQVESLSAEIARLTNTDVGISSTRRSSSSGSYTTEEKMLVDTMKELNASQDKIDAALATFKKRKAQPGR